MCAVVFSEFSETKAETKAEEINQTINAKSQDVILSLQQHQMTQNLSYLDSDFGRHIAALNKGNLHISLKQIARPLIKTFQHMVLYMSSFQALVPLLKKTTITAASLILDLHSYPPCSLSRYSDKVMEFCGAQTGFLQTTVSALPLPLFC